MLMSVYGRMEIALDFDITEFMLCYTPFPLLDHFWKISVEIVQKLLCFIILLIVHKTWGLFVLHYWQWWKVTKYIYSSIVGYLCTRLTYFYFT